MTEQTKPKRKLKAIDFSAEDSHIALVHKDQGGPANGADYRLVLKATNLEPTTITDGFIEKSKLKESKPSGSDTSQILEGKEGVSPIVKKAETTKETKMEKTEELEKVNKALQDNKVMLEKAMEQIAKYEADKKEAIVKSKTDKVKAVIKDAKHAEIIAKACLELESEDDFSAFMAAITAMQATVTTSDMFVEKGLRVEDKENVEVNHLANILKARYQAK